MNEQQALGPNPEWEQDDAYQGAYEAACYGDELWDKEQYWRCEEMLETAMWDEETKHNFWLEFELLVCECDVNNRTVADTIHYLRQYQPRVPYSEVKNPTQKQINAFIRKVCNL